MIPLQTPRLFRGFAGWRPTDLPADLVAGLTLAAIAAPEQMATARLGGLPPQAGFLALIAGAVGFAVFGANKRLSVGADSTIAPIFAGALVALAQSGSPHYTALASVLAALVGLFLVLAGVFRLGFIADLLSTPVTTGFLAGVAAHIAISQGPAILGATDPAGSLIDKVIALAAGAPHANPFTLAIGLGVFILMLVSEKISARLPGALIGVALATALTAAYGLEARGVATLGVVPAVAPTFNWGAVSLDEMAHLVQLAAVVAIVVMVQTAATTRSFVSDPQTGPHVDQDFIGAGAANLVSALVGSFPLDASPPRTAVVSESGGATQFSALIAAALVLCLSLFGADLLRHTPHAALAGVLLFVAQRIFRVPAMTDIWRCSKAEFALIILTFLAIVILPIQQGVGLGILLSMLHGVWTTTRARAVEFERIPGSTIWWPKSALKSGERASGVRVIGPQAPLSFLNADVFRHEIEAMAQDPGVRLIVIEANAIAEIDYTAAKALGEAIKRLRAQKIDVAFARLEALRAQESFARQGLEALVGRDHLFHSVDEAVRALA
ncbi:MAG: SulP family inorganic anion transporter [Hyphomicrobiales bacterium]|nr:SulP family inorganic anion transporter [Hyphomicrobiales bacterium]